MRRHEMVAVSWPLVLQTRTVEHTFDTEYQVAVLIFDLDRFDSFMAQSWESAPVAVERWYGGGRQLLLHPCSCCRSSSSRYGMYAWVDTLS